MTTLRKSFNNITYKVRKATSIGTRIDKQLHSLWRDRYSYLLT